MKSWSLLAHSFSPDQTGKFKIKFLRELFLNDHHLWKRCSNIGIFKPFFSKRKRSCLLLTLKKYENVAGHFPPIVTSTLIFDVKNKNKKKSLNHHIIHLFLLQGEINWNYLSKGWSSSISLYLNSTFYTW